MTEVLHADIFFVITSVAVVIVTALVVVLLVYAIHTMRNVSRISDTVQRTSEEIAQDVDQLREGIKEKSSGLWSLFSFIIKRFTSNKHAKK